MWLVPAKMWIRQYLHWKSFLLSLKKEGKDYINKCTAGQGVVLDKRCTRLLSTVEKVAGKLAT